MPVINSGDLINATYAVGVKLVQTLINANQQTADVAIYKGQPLKVNISGDSTASMTALFGNGSNKTCYIDPAFGGGSLPDQMEIMNTTYTQYIITLTRIGGNVFKITDLPSDGSLEIDTPFAYFNTKDKKYNNVIV